MDKKTKPRSTLDRVSCAVHSENVRHFSHVSINEPRGNKSEWKVNGKDRSLKHAHSHGPEVTKENAVPVLLMAWRHKKSGGL